MAKKEKVNAPKMEGNVSRAVDFNLKKEDLMLLILEGRKENMEEQIAKMQQVSSDLRKRMNEAQEDLEKKVRALCYKVLNADAKKLSRGFATKDVVAGEEEDITKIFKLSLNSYSDNHNYTKYISSPIGDGKGSTYIKLNGTGVTHVQLYNRMVVSIDLSLYGRTFADNKHDILYKKEVRACGEQSRSFNLVDEALNSEFQKELSEYKTLVKIVEKFNENESLLSDILAEYDLFNRNQPRAKAKMIKEVLSRDEAGQALLGDIIQAAQGVKLLA
jgi:BMFP domain-containing protein YqiC